MTNLTKLLSIIAVAAVIASCKKNDQQPAQKTLAVTQTKSKQLFAGCSPFQWARMLPSISELSSITLDESGNIYIVGYSNPDILMKLDPSTGNVLWQKPIEAYKMVFDNKGNVYVLSSRFAGNYTFSFIYLSKLDATNGDIQWQKIIAGPTDTVNYGKPYTQITDFGIDGSNHLYFTGSYHYGGDIDPGQGVHSVTGSGDFILKLNPDGSTAGVITDNQKDNISNTKLLVSTDGSLTFIGWATTNGLNHFEVQSYSNTGGLKFTKSIAVPGFALTATNGSDFYVYEYDKIIEGLGLPTGSRLYRIDRTGNIAYNSQLADLIYRNAMGVDLSGNTYFTGSIGGPLVGPHTNPDFDPGNGVYYLTNPLGNDIYLDQYDQNGKFKGAISFHSPSFGSNTEGQVLQSDKNGNLYLGGKFDTPIDFDPTSGVNILTPTYTGVSNAFLVKLKPCN